MMRRGGGPNGRPRQRGRGNGTGHGHEEAPPAFASQPPPPPFPSSPRPPPPPPVDDYDLYIKPEKVPMESLPYMYDPYGGLPRREDRDPYNTSQPPPRPLHDNDLQPTYRSFREVILSMQSWGVHAPEPTDTSIKRWARRALRAEAQAMAKREKAQVDGAPPAASSSPQNDEASREEAEANANAEDSPPHNTSGSGDKKTSSTEPPENTAQNSGHTPQQP